MLGGVLAVLLPCDRYRQHAAALCMLRPCVKCAESSAGWASVLDADLCWRLLWLIHVLRATVMTVGKCSVECWQCFCRVIDIGCMLRCFVCCVRV